MCSPPSSPSDSPAPPIVTNDAAEEVNKYTFRQNGFILRKVLEFPCDSERLRLVDWQLRSDLPLTLFWNHTPWFTNPPTACGICIKPYIEIEAIPNTAFVVLHECPHWREHRRDGHTHRPNRAIREIFTGTTIHPCLGNVVVVKQDRNRPAPAQPMQYPVVDIELEDCDFVVEILRRWLVQLKDHPGNIQCDQKSPRSGAIKSAGWPESSFVFVYLAVFRADHRPMSSATTTERLTGGEAYWVGEYDIPLLIAMMHGKAAVNNCPGEMADSGVEEDLPELEPIEEAHIRECSPRNPTAMSTTESPGRHPSNPLEVDANGHVIGPLFSNGRTRAREESDNEVIATAPRPIRPRADGSEHVGRPRPRALGTHLGATRIIPRIVFEVPSGDVGLSPLHLEKLKLTLQRYLCGHSHCYVCIRRRLNTSWKCPNCQQMMRFPPFVSFDYSHLLAEVCKSEYAGWEDKSEVGMNFEGLTFPKRERVQDSP
ncbi:hypothetical protein GGX14DRAFT_386250 [Mycena pura]|uniref:Uncharacterized protein n=1 Tax=Mycena pura TaxID=153505 RepID=A0AAD7E372_9AGAR|nr:hypothetical protein GGX14DRAFT_386250 [Mycena pura]